MNNSRGTTVFLTVIIFLLCLFSLSFTFFGRKVENDAVAYSEKFQGEQAYYAKARYLDSLMTNENIKVIDFLGLQYSLKEIKALELNKGLDLQGGMHVTLEISPVDIIKAMSANNDTPGFNAALKEASEMQKSSQEKYTGLFYTAFQKNAPGVKLSDIFAHSANKSSIDFNSSDEDVLRAIDKEVDGAIDRSFNIIRTRIDKFGVLQPNMQKLEGTGRIQIELPGVDNPVRVRKLLQGVAKLEFWEVWNFNEIVSGLEQADAYWVKKQESKNDSDDKGATPAANDSLPKTDLAAKTDSVAKDSVSANDGTLNNDGTLADATVKTGDSSKKETAAADSLAAPSKNSPLTEKLKSGGELVYSAQDTAQIARILADPNVRQFFPSNLKFLWDVKALNFNDPKATDKFFTLHAVKKGRGGEAPLTGDAVEDAYQSIDQFGKPEISMSMNAEGARKWKKLTGANINKRIAIVLDDYVYSAPNVQAEISGGRSSITGSFQIEEAKDLANILKAGKLPAPVRIVEETVVGPSLGVEAQNQGIISIVAGLALVVLFMWAYYSKGGMIANVGLLFNIFFIVGILAQMNAALTLPGIAGIVLTMGMAIDANVLIFERIREELLAGTTKMKAIELGYERAFWTIFDSNLTTLLTAISLYVFGSGPIKGFAVTLIIGILCSFFSAVYITRVIVDMMTKKHGEATNLSFETSFSKNLFQNINIDFIGKRKMYYGVSAVIIFIGLALMLVKGLNMGVDFQGGRSFVVEFTGTYSPSDTKVALTSGFDNKSVEVKTYGTGNKLKITTNYLVDDESEDADGKVIQALTAGLEAFTKEKLQASEGKLEAGSFKVLSSSKVGATIADDIQKSSIAAIMFSLAALFLYIVLRFRKAQFGIGAVVALFHDVLFVFAAFSIANMFGIAFEIDQVFVAAMLTIIGYSINDTVVVFDRIREYANVSSYTAKVLNDAINSTLSRTLMTSFTTLIVVIVLLIFGGEVLRGFSFALLVGIGVGTYSSICIATPVVYDTTGKDAKAEKLEDDGNELKASVTI